MKYIIALLTTIVLGISAFSNENLQKKLDEILEESNLLYRYEKVAWTSTDLAMSKSDLKSKFYGYLIYHTGQSIKAIILNSSANCIAEYTFTDDLSVPSNTNYTKRPLTADESKYLQVKMTAFKVVAKKKYKVRSPQGLSPNIVFIPNGDEYKVYVIQGASQAGIIPFGNDHFFKITEKGKVLEYIKYHKSNLEIRIPEEAIGQLQSVSHSHVEHPYIAPTDICTARLYGPLNGLKEFSVLSTKFGMYFTYDIETNTIEIK